MFDRDEHPKFDEAVQRCESNRVGVARSDPCFEVWLILHCEDYHKGDDRRAAQDRCQQVCRGYDKHPKRLDCTNLREHVEAAINRAEAQLADRANEGEEFGRPSTTVGDLVRRIRDAAKESGRN